MIIMGFVTTYNTSVPNSLVLNLAGVSIIRDSISFIKRRSHHVRG